MFCVSALAAEGISREKQIPRGLKAARDDKNKTRHYGVAKATPLQNSG